MIIEKFEEQVVRNPGKAAVKSGNKTLTYSELNIHANRVAREIINNTPGKDSNSSIVSLLFEHGSDMIVGITGALKANKTYVPLDVTYPKNRLIYMLEHSDSSIILTNTKNLPLAEALAEQSGKKIGIININNIDGEVPRENPKRDAAGNRPAYILYTSGSTGRPKGVVQSHRNIVHFIDYWSRRFSLTGADRISLFASLSHDGAIPDIFGALLNGAVLYPYDIKQRADIDDLTQWLRSEKITIWHSVPTFYRYFIRNISGEEVFPDLRLIVLGGEEVRTHDVTMFNAYFPSSTFANIYGQTESTVNSIWLFSPGDTFKKVIIGEPIGETEILLVDNEGGIVEEVGVGEIVIAGDHTALEYWKDKENTAKVFTSDNELGRLYWTGDMGRLTADGNIAVIGRKDFQVKIRGFRVETGEIETVLLDHPAVKEAAAVIKKDENGDNYLCAYIVSETAIPSSELKEFLTAELPDYMIPTHFIDIEKMPLTPSGKIDRSALPEPGKNAQSEFEYEAPTNEIEKELTAMWQEVLGTEKIGINSNFFDLGGHSLLVITLISKVHQTFNVELQLKDVFDYPTLKELSRLIIGAKQTTALSIEPCEEKDYYEATSEQRRLFILNEFEGIGTTYNLADIIKIEGEIDRHRLQEIFFALIKRHESLRTSFELREGKLVQCIHDPDDIDFQMMVVDTEKENRQSEDEISRIVRGLVKPFDITKAPLIRVTLVKLPTGSHLLSLDMHHIVGDGLSGNILMNEFVRLYNSEELPDLKLNYRDYSEWLNNLLRSGQLDQQEEYWLERFCGEIPVLNFPVSYPRPDVQSFEGEMIGFNFGKEQKQMLEEMAGETGTTLYIVLLAIYTILLYKYTGQEDIVTGSIISGRNHVDLENIVGFFAKTLALRNYPAAHKKFDTYLQEVKESTLKAFENQMYPFTRLVEKLDIEKNPGRNPLFDTAFVLQTKETVLSVNSKENITLKESPYRFGNKTSMFDILFLAFESPGEIDCFFQYNTRLFNREAIELMKERFIALMKCVLDNREKRIQELEYAVTVEKEMEKVQEVEFDF